MEFVFEILHEQNEPLVSAIELLKAGLRLHEYYQLIVKEGVNSYLELASYNELTQTREIKHDQIEHMRQKKLLQKMSTFKPNERLMMLESGSDQEEELDSSLLELGLTDPLNPKPAIQE